MRDRSKKQASVLGDTAFGFLAIMTAVALVVAAAINTAQSHLVTKPA